MVFSRVQITNFVPFFALRHSLGSSEFEFHMPVLGFKLGHSVYCACVFFMFTFVHNNLDLFYRFIHFGYVSLDVYMMCSVLLVSCMSPSPLHV